MSSWPAVFAVLTVTALMAVLEWPIVRRQTKEKAAFAVLCALGCALGILLAFFPEMPGLTQAIDRLFQPLKRFME